ncbi:lipase domain-containing protein [Phthorimaea operculella]|nr:lipase domain-containing protein [Phthorimaea operculella]
MHGIAITAPAIAYSHNPRIQGLVVAAELHASPSRRRPLESSPKGRLGYSNYISQCYDHLPSNQSQLSALVEFIELRFVRSEMYGKILVFLVVCSGVMIVCEDTGYPAGYMADCPGMNRSTTFSEATKESLNVVMIKPSSDGLLGRLIGSQEKRCQLSKDGANCAAKFLDLKGRKLQVLISGYMDASFSPLVRMISSTYLARGRNLAVVEIFPVLVRTYPVAARLTKPLGEVLGTFLAELTLKKGVSPSQIELVGGSLGAHIASFAAVKYSELTGRKPARLTGLDPAGPCFRNLPPSQRFHPDAAEKTDALHTNIDGFGIADAIAQVDFYANGGKKTDALHTNIDGFGIADAIAQVDFYANGGEFQPSMAGSFILPCFVVCSHVRAAPYWMLALTNPDKFKAVRCDSVAQARHGQCYQGDITTNLLGPKTNFSRPGVYYLPTTELPPYYNDGIGQREYGVNNYLLKTAPDKDMVL